MTPAEFVARWRVGARHLTERQAAQAHFADLCRVLGVPTPVEADPTGQDYAYERRVRKVGKGDDGFADVWRRGYFGWEYKRAGRSLVEAYTQLLLYREDLENPPLLVVSDLVGFELHTNFTGTTKKVYRFGLSDLERPEPLAGEDFSALEVLRLALTEPARLDPSRRRVRVTEEATERVGRVALALQNRGHEPGAVARFLVGLVFALFAEDAGLLPNRLLTRILERTTAHPERAAGYLGGLFAAMNEGGEFLLEDVPRFNGGLFADVAALPLTAAEVGALLEVARLDWADVEPAIFGTLFMRSLDPARRGQLGAEYTGREDIVRVVEPVVLEPLRREWRSVRERAEAGAARLAPGGEAYRREVVAPVAGFVDRLHRLRVLDPACGSGNFLYVAMQGLKDLERDALAYAREVGAPGFPLVGPRQFHGLEVNPFAYELASAVVWIGYLQWNRANGYPNRADPILEPLDTIRLEDALLSNAAERPWPEADFVVGNPPFLGDKKMRRELGDEYVERLRRVYGDRVPGQADLVCYWFEKARAEIAAGRTKRAGLIATNSIRGGANRRVLERVKETGDIFMARPDEPWVLDGAAVRISFVGFDDGSETERTLDSRPVPSINADLSSGVDLAAARPLPENANLAFIGIQKGGAFDIPGDLARSWLRLPNPNGRPNADVLRPYVNGMDLVRRPSDTWIIDFNQMPETEASEYAAPFGYVVEKVKPKRLESNRENYARFWWQHQETRPGMRRAIARLPRYLVTPRLTKHRVFFWLSLETLPDSQVVAIARDDDFTFGVLSSRIHEVWSLTMGTSLEDRPRYTPSTTFEPFPFPHPTPEARAEVEKWARYLDGVRRSLLEADGKRTVTGLYNDLARLRLERDPAHPVYPLLDAHERLDRAVLTAYGWPQDLEGEGVLERLLELNLERAG